MIPRYAPADDSCPEPGIGGRYAYFEHDADIGVIGRGAILEEAFEGAVRATFAIMTDIEKVRAAGAGGMITTTIAAPRLLSIGRAVAR